MSWWMARNSDGNKDFLMTVALWTVIAILTRFMISGITAAINGQTFGVGDLDGGLVAALLGPTLVAYVAKKFAPPAQPGITTTTATTERVVVASPTAAPPGDMKVDKMTVDNLEVNDGLDGASAKPKKKR